MRPRSWRAPPWVWLLVAWLFGHAATAMAQVDATSAEYQIKAAFVCKFGAYVEWPSRAFDRSDSPLVIGVAGDNAVVEAMTRAAAQQAIDGRAIVVRRVQHGESLAGLHIVFITRSQAGWLADVLAAAKGLPLLTVTESEQTAGRDSMINFVVVADKVRFDVTPHLAELNQLKISARLLGVARKVMSRPS